MNSTPLKLVTHQRFADYLCRELDTPHTLTTLDDKSDAEIATLLSDADVFVSSVFKAAWRDPQSCTLRLLHSVGAGTDWIESASLPEGCKVCNVYGHQWGVAEQAFMLALVLQKQLFSTDAALRKGDWTPELPLLTELRGRNLLILGLGHVGQELARWGKFLGMGAEDLPTVGKSLGTSGP